MRTRWRLSLLGPLLVLLFSRPIYSGYKHHTLELLLKELEHYVRAEETWQPNNGTTLPRLLSSLPLRMLEFGNQRIHDFNLTHPYQLFDAYGFKANLILPKEPEPEEPQSPRRWVHVPVRPFFEHLGLSYVSVDYNGADGSLPLDVRGTLRDQLREKYDIITNIGFSEHVGEFDTETNFIANQYSIFKNFHELGNAGTLYFHEVPTYFDWHLHGVAGYDVSFFEAMIQRNEYLQGTVVVSDHHGLDKKVVVACYEKVMDGRPFMSLDEFNQLPGLHARYAQLNTVYLSIKWPEESAHRYVVTKDLKEPGALQSESKVLCDLIKDPSPDECLVRTQQVLEIKVAEQHAQFFGQ